MNIWKEIDAQQSFETAIQNEREIRQRYLGISTGEKKYLLDMINLLENKMGCVDNIQVSYLYQQEHANMQTRYKTRYFKKVVEFNESYESGSEEVFCTFKDVELTNEEINNTGLFIEQLISDMRRRQLWSEELHNYNIKRMKGEL